MFKNFLVVVLSLFIASTVYAQTTVASAGKCNGPADVCAQIAELQKKLADQKVAFDQGKDKDTLEKEKAFSEKEAAKAAKMIAISATLAVILKLLLTSLAGWKIYFKTDKGKAWLRLMTVAIGFLAFIATNIGLGIEWWQSLIIAAGGPGAVMVHEMAKIWPALTGKGKLPKDFDPIDGEKKAEDKPAEDKPAV